jgi:hypothetical protein
MSPEMQPIWRKAADSAGPNKGCVEVAAVEGQAWVRDSKSNTGEILKYDQKQWGDFLNWAKEGKVDF